MSHTEIILSVALLLLIVDRLVINRTGLPGIIGPRGDVGPRGEKGDSGPKGDNGPKGDSGPKGDNGYLLGPGSGDHRNHPRARSSISNV